MAYDSARGVTVLFGGFYDRYGHRDGETWEWDGSEWTLEATTGPSPRAEHALAYDSARGVTVLFGGWAPYEYYVDTWEWDGVEWTLRATTGPPRIDPAMAYDSARGVTVLFGGRYRGQPYGDTWEWDGAAWTLRATDGPSPRYDHALAYDSARGVTVLFGGYDGEYDGETWEWDGAAWTLRADTGLSPRYLHAMAYDSARGVTVLFGGRYYDGSHHYYRDTWEWDGAAWTQQFPDLSPSPRQDHAMAYDSARGVTVLFGGAATDFETWEYSRDCNCNGVPDHEDIGNGTSADCNDNAIPDECDIEDGTSQDGNSNGVPDECDCAQIIRLNVKSRGNRGQCKIPAKVVTTLPEGTEVNICFEGDTECGCQTVTINDRGRAKASCITLTKGDHRVCIQECPDLCRTVTCQP
ncbi:MAG: hypothetical protein FLDDKLPJ_03455 [Phycisphaerae bacterium]|nr:hypothetical protein [Phycisphaerae bacterium]